MNNDYLFADEGDLESLDPFQEGLKLALRQLALAEEIDPKPDSSFRHAVQRFEGFAALNATLKVLSDSAVEARKFSLQRLKEIVAEIRHQFWASSAWLFIKNEDHLKAIVEWNTGNKDSILEFADTSVSTSILSTGEPYYTNDAQTDDNVRKTLGKTTQGLIAAPIKAPDGEIIGVICLESKNKFPYKEEDGGPQMVQLLAAATALAPHLIVLKSLDRTDHRWCPWHPRIHNWDLSRVLRKVCHAIAEALNGRESDGKKASGIECAIWNVDYKKRKIQVYATSGHGMEYIKKEQLPLESFTGSVATSSAGIFGRVRPEGAETKGKLLPVRPTDGPGEESFPFRNVEKAAHMGLTEVMAVPIHHGNSDGQKAEAPCVLGVYAYGPSAADRLPSPEELYHIAETLGEVIAEYLRERSVLAASFMMSELYSEIFKNEGYAFSSEIVSAAFSQSTDMELKVSHMEKVLETELIANQAYIYPFINNGFKLGTPSPHDKYEESTAYLKFLLDNPDSAVRINDKGDRPPPSFPGEQISSSEIERLPWNDAQRRSLDIGVQGFGVIRLKRPRSARPFTESDERVLKELAATLKVGFKEWLPANQDAPAAEQVEPIADLDESIATPVEDKQTVSPVEQGEVVAEPDESIASPVEKKRSVASGIEQDSVALFNQEPQYRNPTPEIAA